MPSDGANTSLCNEDHTTAISILRCSGDRVKALRFKITCEYDWALDGTDRPNPESAFEKWQEPRRRCGPLAVFANYAARPRVAFKRLA